MSYRARIKRISLTGMPVEKAMSVLQAYLNDDIIKEFLTVQEEGSQTTQQFIKSVSGIATSVVETTITGTDSSLMYTASVTGGISNTINLTNAQSVTNYVIEPCFMFLSNGNKADLTGQISGQTLISFNVFPDENGTIFYSLHLRG